MAKTKLPKLTVELIPKTCWWSNVRSTVSKKDWDKIRFISYDNANNQCEICASNGHEQGYKNFLECHEIWEYDDENHIQTLIGLISLCVNCHQVKHIGRASKMGKTHQCIKQLAQVNKWTREQIDEHIAESFDVYKERSKHEWTLDLSLLTQEPYNLVIDATKKRVFKVKKFKKKRKKKKIPTEKVALKKIKTGKRPRKKKS